MNTLPNLHTHEQELLLLPDVDFVASGVRAVIFAIREEKGHIGMATHDNSLSMLDWFAARLWTDDMLNAFRQLPVFPEHRLFNTVMWFDTRAEAYRFATVKGMFFGRTSAVNVFSAASPLLRWRWIDAKVLFWPWHMLMTSSQWR